MWNGTISRTSTNGDVTRDSVIQRNKSVPHYGAL